MYQHEAEALVLGARIARRSTLDYVRRDTIYFVGNVRARLHAELHIEHMHSSSTVYISASCLWGWVVFVGHFSIHENIRHCDDEDDDSPLPSNSTPYSVLVVREIELSNKI